MRLSNLQRAAMMPRATERFTPGETLILNALKTGEKTSAELIAEYCRCRANGGPVTADTIVRTLIYSLRKKGVEIQQCSIYRME